MLDQGPTAPLSVWRRAYHQLGIPWPGHTEIRRRHRLTNTDTDTDTAPAITVWQMSWPTPDQHPTNNHTDPNHHHRCDDQPDTGRRLAEALGWKHPPTLTTEQQRQLDAERAIAEAHARRYYGPDTDQPPGPHTQQQQADGAGTAKPNQQHTGQRDRHDHTHHHDQHRRDSRDSRIGGSGKPTQPETTGANPNDQTTATPAAQLARQQQVQPIRSADELTQPGMFDTDQELEEFLAELHATRCTSALTTLAMTVVQIRNDMAWLKQATQALLHHYRISLGRAGQPECGAADLSAAIEAQNTAPDR